MAFQPTVPFLDDIEMMSQSPVPFVEDTEMTFQPPVSFVQDAEMIFQSVPSKQDDMTKKISSQLLVKCIEAEEWNLKNKKNETPPSLAFTTENLFRHNELLNASHSKEGISTEQSTPTSTPSINTSNSDNDSNESFNINIEMLKRRIKRRKIDLSNEASTSNSNSECTTFSNETTKSEQKMFKKFNKLHKEKEIPMTKAVKIIARKTCTSEHDQQNIATSHTINGPESIPTSEHIKLRPCFVKLMMINNLDDTKSNHISVSANIDDKIGCVHDDLRNRKFSDIKIKNIKGKKRQHNSDNNIVQNFNPNLKSSRKKKKVDKNIHKRSPPERRSVKLKITKSEISGLFESSLVDETVKKNKSTIPDYNSTTKENIWANKSTSKLGDKMKFKKSTTSMKNVNNTTNYKIPTYVDADDGGIVNTPLSTLDDNLFRKKKIYHNQNSINLVSTPHHIFKTAEISKTISKLASNLCLPNINAMHIATNNNTTDDPVSSTTQFNYPFETEEETPKTCKVSLKINDDIFEKVMAIKRRNDTLNQNNSEIYIISDSDEDSVKDIEYNVPQPTILSIEDSSTKINDKVILNEDDDPIIEPVNVDNLIIQPKPMSLKKRIILKWQNGSHPNGLSTNNNNLFLLIRPENLYQSKSKKLTVYDNFKMRILTLLRVLELSKREGSPKKLYISTHIQNMFRLKYLLTHDLSTIPYISFEEFQFNYNVFLNILKDITNKNMELSKIKVESTDELDNSNPLDLSTNGYIIIDDDKNISQEETIPFSNTAENIDEPCCLREDETITHEIDIQSNNIENDILKISNENKAKLLIKMKSLSDLTAKNKQAEISDIHSKYNKKINGFQSSDETIPIESSNPSTAIQTKEHVITESSEQNDLINSPQDTCNQRQTDQNIDYSSPHQQKSTTTNEILKLLNTDIKKNQHAPRKTIILDGIEPNPQNKSKKVKILSHYKIPYSGNQPWVKENNQLHNSHLDNLENPSSNIATPEETKPKRKYIRRIYNSCNKEIVDNRFNPAKKKIMNEMQCNLIDQVNENIDVYPDLPDFLKESIQTPYRQQNEPSQQTNNFPHNIPQQQITQELSNNLKKTNPEISIFNVDTNQSLVEIKKKHSLAEHSQISNPKTSIFNHYPNQPSIEVNNNVINRKESTQSADNLKHLTKTYPNISIFNVPSDQPPVKINIDDKNNNQCIESHTHCDDLIERLKFNNQISIININTNESLPRINHNENEKNAFITDNTNTDIHPNENENNAFISDSTNTDTHPNEKANRELIPTPHFESTIVNTKPFDKYLLYRHFQRLTTNHAINGKNNSSIGMSWKEQYPISTTSSSNDLIQNLQSPQQTMLSHNINSDRMKYNQSEKTNHRPYPIRYMAHEAEQYPNITKLPIATESKQHSHPHHSNYNHRPPLHPFTESSLNSIKPPTEVYTTQTTQQNRDFSISQTAEHNEKINNYLHHQPQIHIPNADNNHLQIRTTPTTYANPHRLNTNYPGKSISQGNQIIPQIHQSHVANHTQSTSPFSPDSGVSEWGRWSIDSYDESMQNNTHYFAQTPSSKYDNENISLNRNSLQNNVQISTPGNMNSLPSSTTSSQHNYVSSYKNLPYSNPLMSEYSNQNRNMYTQINWPENQRSSPMNTCNIPRSTPRIKINYNRKS